MGFWSSTRKWLKKNFSPQESAKSENWLGPHYDFAAWGDNNIWGYKNSTLTTNVEIFSIISRLANTISSLPIHLYRNYKETHNNVSDLLTTEANPSMSSFSLINEMEVSRNADGNGYVFIERDKNDGTPIRLWPIDPMTVTVKRNIDDGSIWYEVSNPQFHFLVFNTEIIHVRHITPLSGVVGISPIDVLKGPLDFEKAVEDFSLGEMNKKDAYIIKYDRSVSPEKRQAMINDFVKMIKENGGAVVQEKGFEYDRFESKFQPGDLKTTEEITRSRIANAFDIPLQFLNETMGGNGAGSTSEQLMIQFVQMTIVPIVKQYETEFNRKLLTAQQRSKGFYFKFNVNGLMRGDTASRTNYYQMMIRNGIATPNDLRKLEDLPVVDEPNADKLWFSGDLYPIDMAGQRQPSNNNLIGNPEKGGEPDDQDGKDTQVSNDQAGSQKRQSRHVY